MSDAIAAASFLYSELTGTVPPCEAAAGASLANILLNTTNILIAGYVTLVTTRLDRRQRHGGE
jgi:hypothetical protein